MKNRHEIEEKYKWDLSCYGIDDDNFGTKLNEFKEKLPQLAQFKGKIKTLDDYLKVWDFQYEFSKPLIAIAGYLHAKSDEDVACSKYMAMGEQLEKVSIEYNKQSLYLVELKKKTPVKIYKQMLLDNRFENYHRSIKAYIREKKHNVHKELTKFFLTEDFLFNNSSIFNKFSDADLKFPDILDEKGEKHELNESNYTFLVRSHDRTLRKNALSAILTTYGEYNNFLSENYINSVKSDCYCAKLYKYESAIKNAIEQEESSLTTYNLLIKKTHQHLPILFEFFKLKQQKLGLDDFWIYDTYVSCDKSFDKKFTYDEAIELIKEAVKPLGEEYVDLIQKAKDERWIDVMPNKNKRSGAYQTNYGDDFPPFVLTNFEGQLGDVFTLAHELGHAMHSHYSNQCQPWQMQGYTIFVAEVASTTNELLLLNYLLNHASEKSEKEALYDKFFDEIKSTLFRQTMFGEFEEKIHHMHENDIPLTKDVVNEVYFALNKQYFGENVTLLPQTQYEWSRIPHFFNSFYVYKYATGIISALYFVNRFMKKDKDILNDYFKFLSAGSSDSPINILKKSGCNLEKESTFDEVFEYINKMLVEWKSL